MLNLSFGILYKVEVWNLIRKKIQFNYVQKWRFSSSLSKKKLLTFLRKKAQDYFSEKGAIKKQYLIHFKKKNKIWLQLKKCKHKYLLPFRIFLKIFNPFNFFLPTAENFSPMFKYEKNIKNVPIPWKYWFSARFLSHSTRQKGEGPICVTLTAWFI